ncbi:hypothetical protein ES702_00219 [subsurface metagenome]
MMPLCSLFDKVDKQTYLCEAMAHWSDRQAVVYPRGDSALSAMPGSQAIISATSTDGLAFHGDVLWVTE